MPLIKRYSNRKLYDTEAKQYITLEGIAALIRQGEEVQVVDNDSGEDLTAVTLTQIIFEQEKKRRGFLPQNVLTGLVRAGGDTMTTLRRTLVSSLDLARQVDEEIERRLQALVSRGELAQEEGQSLRAKLVRPEADIPAVPHLDEEYLAQALEARGVPSRDDVQRILEQLDTLAQKLDQVSGESEAPGSP